MHAHILCARAYKGGAGRGGVDTARMQEPGTPIDLHVRARLTPEAERARRSHVQRVGGCIQRLLPTADMQLSDSAEHDVFQLTGVSTLKNVVLERLRALVDLQEFDMASGTLRLFVHKATGARRAPPSRSTLFLDAMLCVFVCSLLWLALHILYPSAWPIHSALESLLMLQSVQSA